MIVCHSTRGTAPAIPLADALVRGLAPDGGLYLPDTIPTIPPTAAADYTGFAVEMLRPWLDGAVPDWEAAVRDALSFPMPIVELLGGDFDGMHVLELWHGPTLSFKDVGARTLARLVTRLDTATDDGDASDPLVVLVATSGDTGSAVADGFAGLDGVRVVLLFPDGRVSDVQERQLVATRPGVTAVRVDGTFDDCQRLVKAAFADPALGGVRLTSANSINLGRLLPQATYHAFAARAVFETTGRAVVDVVPSGNLGNLTAGVLARRAGAPIAGFVAAHNANRAFVDHLAGAPMEARPTIPTPSNAMDVGAPSNFERLAALLTEAERRSLIAGETVSDDETRAAMRAVYDATGYVACPHTAVALDAARRRRGAFDGAPMLVLSTAHPAKFPDAVEQAIGRRPDEPEALARLRTAPSGAVVIAAESAALAGIVRSVAGHV